ncbi:hypothetical protein V8F20_009920 [Naviculisporaceae sp. PSN 640]
MSPTEQVKIYSIHGRVATPPPHPLPIEQRWDEQCKTIEKTFGPSTLASRAPEIFVKYIPKVDIESVGLTSQVPAECHSSFKGQPTIVAVAEWHDQPESSARTWERAVIEVKQAIDSLCLLHGYHDDIGVEIIAEELTRDKFMAPITAELVDQGMGRDWPVIKNEVTNILNSHPATKDHLVSLNIFRLGTYTPIFNPPTVLITVDSESPETEWQPVIDEIQRFLRTFVTYVNLKVQIEHGAVELWPYELHRGPIWNYAGSYHPDGPGQRTHYETKVNLGNDMSVSSTPPPGSERLYQKTIDDAAEMHPLVGTVGCWLEIKTKAFPDGVKVALTSYRVVRPAYEGFKLDVDATGKFRITPPAQGTELWLADKHGVVPSESNNAPKVKVESPAGKNHNREVVVKQDWINFPAYKEKAVTEQELARLVEFFENGKHELGTVYCASGYNRRLNNHLLDWALIMPFSQEERVGKNKLPSFTSWRKEHCSPNEYPKIWSYDSYTPDGVLKDPPPTSGSDNILEHHLKQGELVYMVGATTGPSIGVLNKMPAYVKTSEVKHISSDTSTEYTVVRGWVAKSRPFAKYGDSGSVVWDKDGRLLGLVSRGQKVLHSCEIICYVTPIDVVFRDIKDLSNGEITDIKVLEVLDGTGETEEMSEGD